LWQLDARSPAVGAGIMRSFAAGVRMQHHSTRVTDQIRIAVGQRLNVVAG
jgi:hypothetical protein